MLLGEEAYLMSPNSITIEHMLRARKNLKRFTIVASLWRASSAFRTLGLNVSFFESTRGCPLDDPDAFRRDNALDIILFEHVDNMTRFGRRTRHLGRAWQ